MSTVDLLQVLERLTGSVGAAEVLAEAYETCLADDHDQFKPKSMKALQHLVNLGYLRHDFEKRTLIVQLDKITRDLTTFAEAA